VCWPTPPLHPRNEGRSVGQTLTEASMFLSVVLRIIITSKYGNMESCARWYVVKLAQISTPICIQTSVLFMRTSADHAICPWRVYCSSFGLHYHHLSPSPRQNGLETPGDGIKPRYYASCFARWPMSFLRPRGAQGTPQDHTWRRGYFASASPHWYAIVRSHLSCAN